MKSIPTEFQQEFNNETKNLGVTSLLIASYTGIILIPLFSILDSLLVPDLHIFFFKLRLFGILILIVLVILTKVSNNFVRKHVFILSMIGCLFGVSIPITIMIHFFGGHESPYYVGLILIIICAGLIFPWNLIQGGIVFSLMYGAYLGTILLFNNVSNWPIFFNNNFFLLSSIIYAMISLYVHGNNRKKAFISRLELVQAKNTIQNAFTELKQVDNMKTNFLSSVSHELRTPLTSVLGFAGNTSKIFAKEIIPLLKEKDSKVDKKITLINDNLSIIVSEGQRLTRMINDVLDISKMEAGKIELKTAELDLIQICKQSLSIVAGYPKSNKVNLDFKYAGNSRPIKGDADRIIQVITNLISNALKFTEEGNIILKIEFLEECALVSIQDSGIGISKSNIHEVFSKFKQLGDGLINKPKGTGLGLPICKEIVKHLGGKIWVESEVDKGSCFYFTLNYYF